MTLFMLIKRLPDGRVRWLLGGGSSTKASARIYETRQQAEYQSKRLREVGPFEIVEVRL